MSELAFTEGRWRGCVAVVAAGHDGDAIRVEVQHADEPDRLGRHRVGLAVVHDDRAGADQHRKAKGELVAPAPSSAVAAAAPRRAGSRASSRRSRSARARCSPAASRPAGGHVRFVVDRRVLEERRASASCRGWCPARDRRRAARAPRRRRPAAAPRTRRPDPTRSPGPSASARMPIGRGRSNAARSGTPPMAA